MGKVMLTTLVGIWMFNLAILVAGGVGGKAPMALAAAPRGAIERENTPLAAGVALAVRVVDVSPDERMTVTVGLMLAEPAIIDLDLYDSSGYRVCTQTTRRLPAGRARVQVVNHERLAPGEYWIRARVGDQIATRPFAIHR